MIRAEMKNYLPLLFALLFLSSCLKDDDNDNELIIDPETFGYIISWTETRSKTGESEWESITDGNQLHFYTNYVDEAINMPDNGKILYETETNVNIRNESYFERTDSTFVIYSSPLPEEADTVTVNYTLVNDSILIITDNTVSPIVEIEYQRAE